MAEIDSWSTSASLNTTVSGVFIGEGADRADMNDAIRAVMAGVKEFANGQTTSFKTVPYTGVPATDTAAFQALLDDGGQIFVPKPSGGVFTLSAGLCIYSDTYLYVEPGTTFKLANGVNQSLLQNDGYYNRATNRVDTDLSWSSGYTLTLNWAVNHNCIPGDYVDLQDGEDGEFLGVFPVISTPTGNEMQVRLQRLPVAGPTSPTGGPWTVRKADRNIKVEGGIWDYNFANNPGAGSVPNSVAHVIRGAVDWELNDTGYQNTASYCVLVGNVAEFRINRPVVITDLQSDFIKVIGAAWNGEINEPSGNPGDDYCSFQPYIQAAFSGYRMSWGDIHNVWLKNVVGTDDDSGATSFLRLYHTLKDAGSYDPRMDNVGIDGAYGHINGRVLSIFDDLASPNGKMGRAYARNVACRAANSHVEQTNGVVDTLEVQLLDGALTTTGADKVSIASAATCKRIRLKDWEIDNSNDGLGAAVNIVGAVESVTAINCVYKPSSSFFVAITGTDTTFKTLTITNCDIEVATSIFRPGTAAFADKTVISVQGGRLKTTVGSGNHFFDLYRSAAVSLQGVRLDCGANVVQANNGASPLIELTAHGCSLTTGNWGGGSGNGTITPKSFEISIDITQSYVARTVGGMCRALNGGGTLATGAPVICDQTAAANSWHSISDPTVAKY